MNSFDLEKVVIKRRKKYQRTGYKNPHNFYTFFIYENPGLDMVKRNRAPPKSLWDRGGGAWNEGLTKDEAELAYALRRFENIEQIGQDYRDRMTDKYGDNWEVEKAKDDERKRLERNSKARQRYDEARSESFEEDRISQDIYESYILPKLDLEMELMMSHVNDNLARPYKDIGVKYWSEEDLPAEPYEYEPVDKEVPDGFFRELANPSWVDFNAPPENDDGTITWPNWNKGKTKMEIFDEDYNRLMNFFDYKEFSPDDELLQQHLRDAQGLVWESNPWLFMKVFNKKQSAYKAQQTRVQNKKKKQTQEQHDFEYKFIDNVLKSIHEEDERNA